MKDILARAYLIRCEEYGWKASIRGYEAFCDQVKRGVRYFPHDLLVQEGLSESESRLSSELPDSGNPKQSQPMRKSRTRKTNPKNQ